MVLDEPGRPLQARELPDPQLHPSRPGEVLVEVHACGVCRTDLHIRDGEVRGCKLPVIPGHQIVATVLAAGAEAAHAPGTRGGIPWLGWTDGTSRFCTSGRENLCE
ncbi:MAG: alcohol dehydrogenase catalytic domain-containing protein, partial [Solirubrobacteraceae bacterium]